ncbi:MAG: 3-dehydroquinate synthase [Oscillospiraceae bacterium]|nr:3-dehydroquinate synthase [Oscillospiraceae bacterium]
MSYVSVSASKSYTVEIAPDLLKDIGSRAASIHPAVKAAVISDSNVWPLYGQTVVESMEKAGFEVIHFVFNAGEASKNSNTYLEILNFLASSGMTRSDILIALGGGVVGDMTGFVAATYLRGIAFIQVPTTLLAMVDSSVGGKTAIDLPTGKNLVGAFYQPDLVLCDINTLSTLPESIFCDGCAEVIKYGILYDEKLFSHLEAYGLLFDRLSVVTRCVEWKRDVVAEDEFDRGSRQKLNLGHTIGHGIETSSRFSISHGQAVSTGIAIIARAAQSMGICSSNTCQRITNLLTRFKLPITTDYTASQLFNCALSDKKRAGSTVNLIIPKEIGNCIISPTAINQLETIIEAGL